MVSIVMAVYNGEKYIKEQLESIENQTYRDWKLIIRDDGSTDATGSIIEAFAGKVSQSVILLKNNSESAEERGAKYNFLALLEQVSDSYVMFADQDDIWMECKIEKTLQKMQEKEKEYGSDTPVLVHTDVEVVDENGSTMQKSFFSFAGLRKESSVSHLMIQNNVTGCAMMINRALLEGMGNLESVDKKNIIMHDYWIALYAQIFGKICFLDQTTMKYRQHNANSVGAKDSKNIFYLMRRFLEGRKRYVRDMQASRQQIQAFVMCYKDRKFPGNAGELFEIYASLGEKSKWRRICFYIKYRVWKNGFIRKVMQILWG